MAANTNPIFIGSPLATALSQISAANSGGRDAPNNLVTVVVAGDNGSWINLVRFKSTQESADGASTQALIQIYLNDGTNDRLLAEAQLVSADPDSASVASAQVDWVPPADFIIPKGWTLKAGVSAIHANDEINCIAFGGNL